MVVIKIKIIYLTISYNVAGSTLYNDLVNELMLNEHQITIVRLNNYSELKVEKLSEKMSILNVRTSDFFKNKLIGKGILTLFMGAFFKHSIKKYLKEKKYDIVLYATPPITFNSVVKYCKEKYKCKSFLMLKDIFPQNAVDLQMFSKKNPIHCFFRLKEKQLYKNSDLIGCMSNRNIEYLKENNDYLNRNKIVLFSNSIKLKKLTYLQNLKKETYFIFGGNLGKPQYITGILKIIDLLKDFNDAKFIICGDGTEKKYILRYLNKINCSRNIKYYEMLSRADYDDVLNQADVGLISLDPRFTIPNIPSKLQNYMLLKKPIFAFIDHNTDVSEIITQANCGWYSFSDDIEKACEIIKFICSDKNLQKEKGISGFYYLKDNYDIAQNVRILEKFKEEK